MTAENDLVKLYSDRILALATDIPHQARLDTPDASVKRRAPLCGSTVTVDVTMQDGKVTGYGQDVKACALGQAAAAVVGLAVIGTTADQIVAARDALKAMLKEDGPTRLPLRWARGAAPRQGIPQSPCLDPADA